MTPDKICVAPHQIFDYDLEIQEVGHNGAEEYIRKEALLEWLESKIKDLPKRGFVNCIATLSYKDVVEHINEM